MEIWKDIKGYEGLYQVSNKGNVRSLVHYQTYHGHTYKYGGNKVKGLNSAKGYKILKLSKDGITKGFQVHRLVAQAFIDNPDNKPQVNHINGIKYDNRVENLEWNTRSENQLHAVRTGLRTRTNNKPVKQIDLKTGEVIRIFESVRKASMSLGGNCSSAIHNVCLHKKGYHSYKGYGWEYNEGVKHGV